MNVWLTENVFIYDRLTYNMSDISLALVNFLFATVMSRLYRFEESPTLKGQLLGETSQERRNSFVVWP